LNNNTILGAYVFILAIIIGFELIARVPSMLHTPLMSGTNAIHGVVLVGAIVAAGQAHSVGTDIMGFVAVVLGSLNVFGGFVVTDRMLQMFKPRTGAARPNGESSTQGFSWPKSSARIFAWLDRRSPSDTRTGR
jgi:H+-translocating NAD(P) transhydrogenase subunit alpha